MIEVLKQAANHKGTAFIEIFQNCLVFNDNAFINYTDNDLKEEHAIYLQDGKPLLYGKNNDKAIKLAGFHPDVISTGSCNPNEIFVHHESAKDRGLAYVLGQMGIENPELPVAFGIFRKVTEPTYQERILDHERQAKEKNPNMTLEQVLNTGDTWTVV